MVPNADMQIPIKTITFCRITQIESFDDEDRVSCSITDMEKTRVRPASHVVSHKPRPQGVKLLIDPEIEK